MSSNAVTKKAVDHSKQAKTTLEVIRAIIKKESVDERYELSLGPFVGKILRTRRMKINSFIRNYPSDLVGFVFGISESSLKNMSPSDSNPTDRTGEVWEVTLQVDKLKIFPTDTGQIDDQEDFMLLKNFYSEFYSSNETVDFVDKYKDKTAAIELALERINRFHKAYYCVGLDGNKSINVKSVGESVRVSFMNEDFELAKVLS